MHGAWVMTCFMSGLGRVCVMTHESCARACLGPVATMVALVFRTQVGDQQPKMMLQLAQQAPISVMGIALRKQNSLVCIVEFHHVLLTSAPTGTPYIDTECCSCSLCYYSMCSKHSSV
jgi:hypothetical protein